MAPNDKAGRVVFIGNIGYGVPEETIVDTLRRVGEVVHFRLVYDKETGKPKGFGFAEFSDGDAASSAVRNLNDFDLMGRKLRVDWSNDGGSGDNAPAGYNAPSQHQHQQPPMNGQEQNQNSIALPPLPPGQPLEHGLTAPDAISRTLKQLPASQLLDILLQMKGLVMSDPAKATELLKQAPQLAYAIFQSLLLLGLVDTNVLTTILEQTAVAPQPTPQQAPPVQPLVPQASYPGYPPQPYAAVPTPPVAHQQYQPPLSQPAPPQQNPGTDALIRQVLAMTPQQIDAIQNPIERQQIVALQQQLMAQYGRA